MHVWVSTSVMPLLGKRAGGCGGVGAARRHSGGHRLLAAAAYWQVDGCSSATAPLQRHLGGHATGAQHDRARTDDIRLVLLLTWTYGDLDFRVRRSSVRGICSNPAAEPAVTLPAGCSLR
eukprot:jgi/Ulvmu1/7709/UM039_0015.1